MHIHWYLLYGRLYSSCWDTALNTAVPNPCPPEVFILVGKTNDKLNEKNVRHVR
jgi:hypothetical protein